MNILVVDDQPENLLAMEALLGDLGENIIQARSGLEALKALLGEDMAVILLDVQMPEMNGYETAAIIRSRENTRHTPIIFLTAINDSPENIARGYSMGAVDYLTKPFDPFALKAKVRAFIEMSRNTAALREEIKRREQAEAEVRRLNAELEQRVVERTAKLEREIGERKRAEAHIQALNERLQRAMTETHHRVKNNLQIIAAMVDMRLMEYAETVPCDEVRRLGRYVTTLASVHDLLTHQAKEDAQAHFLSTSDLFARLLPLVQESAHGRPLSVEVDDTPLGARQGTSLALVVTELVNNAIKHGRGDIGVFFKLRGRTAELLVDDDGPGFPPDFDVKKSANTGLELVENLSRWDLAGEVTYENRPEGGGRVRVRMPLGQNGSG